MSLFLSLLAAVSVGTFVLPALCYVCAKMITLGILKAKQQTRKEQPAWEPNATTTI